MKLSKGSNQFISELIKQDIYNFDLTLLDKLGEDNMLEICEFAIEHGDFNLRGKLTSYLGKSNLNLQKELK